jgi:large subunit ribosomal protein L25
VSPGVKSQGGLVSHMRTEVEVSCLPKDLPEFIEVDISGLSLNESIHLSQLKVPVDVVLVELAKEDAAVVAIHSPRAEEPEPTAAEAAPAAEGAAAVPAAGTAAAAAPAAGADAAKTAAPAKKEEAKKEPAKKDAKK